MGRGQLITWLEEYTSKHGPAIEEYTSKHAFSVKVLGKDGIQSNVSPGVAPDADGDRCGSRMYAVKGTLHGNGEDGTYAAVSVCGGQIVTMELDTDAYTHSRSG
jgi:hypothetical protein